MNICLCICYFCLFLNFSVYKTIVFLYKNIFLLIFLYVQDGIIGFTLVSNEKVTYKKKQTNNHLPIHCETTYICLSIYIYAWRQENSQNELLLEIIILIRDYKYTEIVNWAILFNFQLYFVRSGVRMSVHTAELPLSSNFVILRFGYRLHNSENICFGKCKTPRLTRQGIRLLRTCSPDAMQHTEKNPNIINQKQGHRKIQMY